MLEMDERNRLIGENVRKYRLLKAMTQDELAEGICSVSQLSKVENGKTYIKRTLLKQIAERLGVTVEQLETADAMRDEIREMYTLAGELSNAGNHVKALELLRQAIEKSRACGYPDLLVMGLSMEAFLQLYVQRDFKKVIGLVEGAFRQGLPIDGQRKVTFFLYLGEAYQSLGNRVVAYDYFFQADEEFQRLEEQGNQESYRLSNLFNLSRNQYWMGNVRTALRYAEMAEQLARENSKHVWHLRCLGHLAFMLTEAGEYARAVTVYDSALREMEGSARLYEKAVTHANYGLLRVKQGDLSAAIHQTEKAMKVYDLIGEKFHMSEALTHMAEFHYELGNAAKVEGYLQEMFDLVKRIPHNTILVRAKGHRMLGWLARDRGDFEAYVAHLEEAMRTYGEQHIGDEPYDVAVELAEALYLRGDERMTEMYHRAIRYAQKTVAFARQIR